MARPKTPRTAWIDAGLSALAARGVDAVRVEVLARDLGVTKGGFYGYFDGRVDLLASMLARWEHTVTDSVVADVDSDPSTDPRDRLRRLMSVLDDDARPAMRIDTEVAVRDWSRRDPAAAEVVRRVDRVRGAYLRTIFLGFCPPDEAEFRTTIAMSVRLAGQTMTFASDAYAEHEIARLVEGRLLA